MATECHATPLFATDSLTTDFATIGRHSSAEAVVVAAVLAVENSRSLRTTRIPIRVSVSEALSSVCFAVCFRSAYNSTDFWVFSVLFGSESDSDSNAF